MVSGGGGGVRSLDRWRVFEEVQWVDQVLKGYGDGEMVDNGTEGCMKVREGIPGSARR